MSNCWCEILSQLFFFLLLVLIIRNCVYFGFSSILGSHHRWMNWTKTNTLLCCCDWSKKVYSTVLGNTEFYKNHHHPCNMAASLPLSYYNVQLVFVFRQWLIALLILVELWNYIIIHILNMDLFTTIFLKSSVYHIYCRTNNPIL